MLEKIILLLDYKSTFSSKFNSTPPYSGLFLKDFISEMKKFSYDVVPLHFFEIDFENPQSYASKKILFQSSEANDTYSEYKSYIDDIVYFLQMAGAQLIPDYKYFKAHSNKNFMEMLRGFTLDENKPETRNYGSLEDFHLDKRKIDFPVVIKKSHGAQSKGVFMAANEKELLNIVENITASSYTFKELLKEKLRKLKYKKSYIPFSINRNKFIIQTFISGLTGDYKVIIFNDIFYLVKRSNRPNDFRASGGGLNTFTGDFDIPKGMLDYAYGIFKDFKCPYISLDIGLNNQGFNLIEFQFLSFGSAAHCKSRVYIKKIENEYAVLENNLSLEYLYSYSINAYLKQ